MTIRITNAFRIISIIALVFVFFIAYAGLPEQVLVLLDNEGNPTQYIGRNMFFYGTLSFLIITNLLFYVFGNLLRKSTHIQTQTGVKFIFSLAIIVNIFFAVALTFLGILNGQENFDYSSFAPFIYFSIGLFVAWVVAFMVSLAKAKKMV